jgi:hypothetical protein
LDGRENGDETTESRPEPWSTIEEERLKRQNIRFMGMTGSVMA